MKTQMTPTSLSGQIPTSLSGQMKTPPFRWRHVGIYLGEICAA